MTITPSSQPMRPAAAIPEPVPEQRSRKDRFTVNRPLVPLELEITGFASGARGIGRAADGRIVFVDYALPGEKVIAEVTADHPDYMTATAVQVLRASPERVAPPCEYFGKCGGCQLQHANYDEQLRLKTGIVREQFVRIARMDADAVDAVVQPMLGMDDPWHYRNHMRFTVRRDGDVGFMQRGTHRFMRIDECAIALPRVNQILNQAQGRTMEARQLTVRVGENSDEEMIQPKLRWRPKRPGPRPESGQRAYSESLLGETYRVSGPAFFQVNTRQAERLVALALERIEAVSPRVVVDGYAGVGTFAVQLAPRVEQVITIEESAAAGDDAEVNLAGLTNVRRVVAKMEAALPGLTPSPDVVIIDPPRAGLARSVVEAILESAAKRVVYVSCDPATLARDVRLLCDGGFALQDVQPIDMFPHTQHIECVTTLDRVASPPDA
ncbi:MAG: class I SAM-dependent RNA methyltransferase [Chloroflexi bacterium]|nr:class I SAM-dependent RNA methyltransferase [Chloroflexota bacterium]